MDAFDSRRSLCALWRFPVRLETFVNFGGGYEHLEGTEVVKVMRHQWRFTVAVLIIILYLVFSVVHNNCKEAKY